jgi:hypothetical protein
MPNLTKVSTSTMNDSTPRMTARQRHRRRPTARDDNDDVGAESGGNGLDDATRIVWPLCMFFLIIGVFLLTNYTYRFL